MTEALDRDEYDLDPRRLVASLRRWMWLVVAVPIVFGAAAYAGARYLGPGVRYESSVSLLVEGIPSGLGYPGAPRDEVDLDTEVLLATSFPVLARVSAALGLLPPGVGWEAHWASPEGRRVLTDLEARVSARRQGGTRVLQLFGRAEDPEGAQRLAEALAEAYRAERLLGRAGRMRELREWLGERRIEAERQLATRAAELAEFLRQHREARLPEEQEASAARFSAALVDLDRTQRRLAETQVLLGELRGGKGSRPLTGLRLLEDDEARISARLVARYAELQAQRQALLVGRRPSHPAVVAVDRQLAGIRDALGATVAAEARSLARQVARQQALVEALRGEAAEVPAAALRLAQLRRAVSLEEERVASLAKREHEALVREQEVFPEVVVLRPASLPSRPVGPTPLVKTLAGAALGLVVGLVLAVGLGASPGEQGSKVGQWARRAGTATGVVAGVATVLLASYVVVQSLVPLLRTLPTYARSFDPAAIARMAVEVGRALLEGEPAAGAMGAAAPETQPEAPASPGDEASNGAGS